MEARSESMWGPLIENRSRAPVGGGRYLQGRLGTAFGDDHRRPFILRNACFSFGNAYTVAGVWAGQAIAWCGNTL